METPRKCNDKQLEIIPECDDTLKPYIGRIFDTVEQFEVFYKNYAHHVGFSVRSSTATKDKNGILKYKYYVCSKEGYKIENKSLVDTDKEKTSLKKRLSTREGCNAASSVKRTEEGNYRVINFYEGHCHDLCTPTKKHFLRSNRKMTNVQKKNLLTSSDVVNIGPTKAVHLLNEQAEGFQNIEFTVRNILSELSEEERRKRLISSVWVHLSRCVEVAEGDEETLNDLIRAAIGWEKDIRSKFVNDGVLSNVSSIYKSNVPTEIDILAPKMVRTKGNEKRLKGGQELSFEVKQKIARLCRACGEHALHDSRNCPKKQIHKK